MSKSNGVSEKWNAFYHKIQPGFQKTGVICRRASEIFGKICDLIYKLRKLILALPVMFGAVYLAVMNSKQLPEEVGLNFLPNGEYGMMITRNVAIYGPLAVTAVCLLLMLISKKVLYPWAISVFTLIIPVFILVSNCFPA